MQRYQRKDFQSDPWSNIHRDANRRSSGAAHSETHQPCAQTHRPRTETFRKCEVHQTSRSLPLAVLTLDDQENAKTLGSRDTVAPRCAPRANVPRPPRACIALLAQSLWGNNHAENAGQARCPPSMFLCACRRIYRLRAIDPASEFVPEDRRRAAQSPPNRNRQSKSSDVVAALSVAIATSEDCAASYTNSRSGC